MIPPLWISTIKLELLGRMTDKTFHILVMFSAPLICNYASARHTLDYSWNTHTHTHKHTCLSSLSILYTYVGLTVLLLQPINELRSTSKKIFHDPSSRMNYMTHLGAPIALCLFSITAFDVTVFHCLLIHLLACY